MNAAQIRILRRFARQAVADRDYTRLAAFVDAYADRAESSPEAFADLRPRHVTYGTMADKLEQVCTGPSWLERFKAWWRGA